MSIPFDTACLKCHLLRYVEKASALGTQAQAMRYARDLMRVYCDAPADVPSPYFSRKAAQLLREHYGVDADPYAQEKAESNAFVLARMPHIREKVRSADDPVLAGLQFAILGNYIDFSALRDAVSFEALDEMLLGARAIAIDPDTYTAFCRELETGKRIVYLTDNAGEIGFDRIFAEELARRYPHLSIKFCVRGGAALNDALREDATLVGVPFPVIDSGSDIPGTYLPELGDDAREAITHADLIISKGQGNAETLLGCGLPIYYAFLIKCTRFVEFFDKPQFTPMFVREAK